MYQQRIGIRSLTNLSITDENYKVSGIEATSFQMAVMSGHSLSLEG